MLNERFSSNLKLFVTRITHNRASLVRPREVDSPWLLYHVDKWLPMLLAVVLSIGLAMLIVDEAWHLAVPVVLLIPAVILFNRYPFIVVVVWLVAAPFIQNTPTTSIRIMYWLIHRTLLPSALIVILVADQLKKK